MSGIPPYETRQASLGLASKDQVKAAAAQSGAFFLDVRTAKEAAEEPFGRPSIQHSCTPQGCDPGLEEKVKMFCDKNGGGPAIVFCRSGRRAMTAKALLEKMGCKQVLNAGGVSDLDYLSK